MDAHPGADVLAQALAADEALRQAHLQAAAWRLLRLGPDAAFECELPAVAAAAGSRGPSAAPGSSGGGSGGGSGDGGSSGSGGSSEPFRFGGSLDELRYLTYAVHWLEGTELGRQPASAGAWVPYNGRIRLQRGGAPARGGPLGRLLGRSSTPAAADAYQLAVWPAAAAGADPLQAGSEPQGEPAVAALGQRQLAALMDCIDAFAGQHPGWVCLQLPEPLQAPPPGLRQRLGALLSGGGDGGSSGDAAAALPPGTSLGDGTPV